MRPAMKIRNLFIAVILLAGCAVKPKMISPNYAAPARIAVLPMSNQSNDLKGPEYVREVFIRNLESRGYVVASVKETDELLRTKLGITDGGQLRSTTAEKICKTFRQSLTFNFGFF